ncbi:hypothetical protein [Streptomyces sp. SM14]|uniref:hypothetical protein n=1 Tax=Streptomyces sp. SM14 TaxID=1736045 RepID=UPI0015E1A8B5|nr:hypothetical protein [Streptomyces sp. SM14]
MVSVKAVHAQYHSGSYKSVASQLPGLLRDANSAVAHYDNGEDHRQALLARAEALQLAGRYLTQVRQYDLGHTALAGAITDARRAADTLTAASGVIGMCWLLLRQGRLDEAEALAAQTADMIEPRLYRATPDECAAWGWLALRTAAATGRNNRPQEARHYHRVATTAASAVGRELTAPTTVRPEKSRSQPCRKHTRQVKTQVRHTAVWRTPNAD